MCATYWVLASGAAGVGHRRPRAHSLAERLGPSAPSLLVPLPLLTSGRRLRAVPGKVARLPALICPSRVGVAPTCLSQPALKAWATPVRLAHPCCMALPVVPPRLVHYNIGLCEPPLHLTLKLNQSPKRGLHKSHQANHGRASFLNLPALVEHPSATLLLLRPSSSPAIAVTRASFNRPLRSIPA